MGMMTKMRDNAHIFLIAFIVIFIAFWVLSDLDVSTVLKGSQNEVGNIDGKSIKYQEFQATVEQVLEERKKQNQGQEFDDNAIASIREQVWNDYVTRAVIDRAIKEMNIGVSDQEITDWVRNYDNPPEALATHFKDSTGKFNKEGYIAFVSNPGQENQKALVQIEKQLKDEIIRSKLTAILSSSIFVTEQDLRYKFMESSTQLAANYIFFDPRILAAKDTGKPNDEEFKEYYEKNKEQYRMKEMRKLKFVSFPETPSASDSNAVRTDLTSIADQASKGADFMELLKNSSEQPYRENWYSRQQFAPGISESLFDKPVGSIVGPLPMETGYSLYKILEEREAADPLVQASHILFRTDGGQDANAAKANAEKALSRAKAGENFTDLAKQLSEEPGAKESGGALGWFGKGRMVPEFEAAVMKAKVGDVIGPVKTQFGYHVIKLTGRSAKELKLAEIRMSIKASSRTRDDVFQRARNFAYLASETSFEQEAKESGLKIEETPEFAKQSGSYIPNIGVNPSLLKFAFENSVGKLSEVHRSANGYVVAMVSGVLPAGFRPLDQIKAQVTPQVIFERQMKNTLRYAQSLVKAGSNLQSIAAANPALSVQFTNLFTLGSGATGVGRDEAFTGMLLRLKQGQMSPPFRGQRGVYVVQLENRNPIDEAAYKVKKTELRNQSQQQFQNEFIQAWLDEMKEKISITDNRDRFYR